MTTDCWKALGVISLLYFGAFLTGIRPGRWYGTRLFPLIAAGIVALFLEAFPPWPLVRFAAGLLVAACLAALIDFTARERDFS
jgi:hypothetical protein